MASVLVTGAGGFVGRAAVRHFRSVGWRVTATSSRPAEVPGSTAAPALEDRAAWAALLRGHDAVVHLAARAHVPEAVAIRDRESFEHVNVVGTRVLADAAADAGVGRFVFASSIGVNGSRTLGRPFAATDEPRPAGTYAEAKRRAELALAEVAAARGLVHSIVRPVLVVGPGAPGNLARLAALVERGVPLPFGALRNRRSFVAVDALASLLCAACTAAGAAGAILLAAQSPALSTGDVVRLIGAGMGRRARLLPVPPVLLRAAGTLVGRGDDVARLLDSLEVDASDTVARTGWQAGQGVEDALRALGRHRREQASAR